MSEEEFGEARASTPNSHYTPDFIIDEIYKYLSNYDVKNILEPSAGTGRFLKDTEKKQYTAIELDSIPSRIIRKLYPKVDVINGGYEETELEDNRFDAVIGNVPFGNYSLYDKRYSKEKFLIHEYFFAKSLDVVKDNGLIVLITGKGTMDKESGAVRKYISDRAELLGAIRLPSSVFSKIAGTDVSADILILRKRSHKNEKENSWLELGYAEDKVPVNEYYLHHPEHMLGRMQFDHRFFGQSSKYTNCFVEESADIKSMLKSAFLSIPVFAEEKEATAKRGMDIIENKVDMECFTYAVFDKKIYYRNGESFEVQKLGESRTKVLESMIDMRNHILLMLKEQREACTNERLTELQSSLKEKYDSFVSKFGEISLPANQQLFENDRYSAFVFSLEQKDGNGKRIYSQLFTERVVKAANRITQTDNVEDALLLCLNEKGKLHLPYMKKLLGGAWKEKDIVRKLNGKVMYNPELSEYETAEEYLSGNVRAKLSYVEDLLKKDIPQEFQEVLKENEAALRKVIPTDLVASEIEVRLGTTWVTKEDYESFMYETLKTPNYLRYGANNIGIEYNPYTSNFYIRNKNSNYGNVLVYQTYGTERKNAYEIIESTLNLRQIKLYDIKNENGKEIKVLNIKETLLVKEKQNLLKDEFRDWIWKDEARRKKYETFYNENFNNLVLREYNGDFLTFSDMNPQITLHEHQRQAIARYNGFIN